MSLRAHLVALVLAALLPVLVFSGFVVVLLARQQQANVERGLRETARALALAVDEQIDNAVTTLRVLAISDTLDRDDLAAFHRLATRVAGGDDGWLLVGLATPEGRQILNTRRPYGALLPPVADGPALREVLRTRKPAVSDLLEGRVSGRPSVVVAAPVERDSRLRYVLFAAIDPQSLTRTLQAQQIATEWTAALLDRNRVIIARSRAAETMLGRPATPGLTAATREAAEGSFRDVTQEGRPVRGAFSRAPDTGWTVVLGVPVEEIGAASRRAIWMVALGGLALLGVGVSLAGLVGRRIARLIGALAAAAAALGRGETPAVADRTVSEVHRVAREIEEAGLRRARAERRITLLAEASRVLAASLDYETALRSVATLAVLELADVCVIDLLEPDGSFRRVAAAAADPRLAEAVERLKAYPPDPSRPHPALEVVRTGRPQRLDALGPSSYARVAADEAHLALLRDLALASVLFVPLVSPGRTLGALWLGTRAGAPVLDSADLALAEDLGRRAAAAVDHAWLYREAQEAITVRDAFLARASHELRTPLTSAVATMRLLERAMAGRLVTDPEELLAIANRNLDAMLGLVNNLLDASKLSAGEEPLAAERVDLEGLVSASLDLVAVQAKDKGIEVVRRVAPGVSLLGDRLKLEQVLVNLLANAIKFTSPGGAVAVEATPDQGTGVLVRVRDTGMGIADAHIERIFEPFFQAGPGGASRGSRGTGLGLAICRQIVSLHRGQIWAESEGPGRGSTFVVRLPGVPGGARAA